MYKKKLKQNLLKKLSKELGVLYVLVLLFLMDFLTAFRDVALRPGYRIRVRALPCRDLSVSLAPASGERHTLGKSVTAAVGPAAAFEVPIGSIFFI